MLSDKNKSEGTSCADPGLAVRDQAMKGDAAFYILCREDRQGMYNSYLAELSLARVRFFVDVEALLMECLTHPPQAVIIDIFTQIAIGSEHVTYLYNLQMAWPVMRCKDQNDGTFSVMCHDPAQTSELLTAMRQILSKDPMWVTEGCGQTHVRMDAVCRARYRLPGGDWLQSNTLDISVDGLFLVMYEQPPMGTVIEVEFLGVVEWPFLLHGAVAEVRDWFAGSSLPGVRVTFDNNQVSWELAEFIASHDVASVYRKQSPN